MKTLRTKSGTPDNVPDAAAKLAPKRSRGTASLPGLRVLKRPVLSKEDSNNIDLYIAARRKEQAASAAAEGLKARVLSIVREHQQIARRGGMTGGVWGCTSRRG